jgi:hypothetical protein
MKRKKKQLKIRFRETNLPHSCLLDSVLFADAVKAKVKLKKHNARLLQIAVTRVEAHAICVFSIEDEWFVYDTNAGAYSIGKWKTPPTKKQIAKALYTDNLYEKVSSPTWLR